VAVETRLSFGPRPARSRRPFGDSHHPTFLPCRPSPAGFRRADAWCTVSRYEQGAILFIIILGPRSGAGRVTGLELGPMHYINQTL